MTGTKKCFDKAYGPHLDKIVLLITAVLALFLSSSCFASNNENFSTYFDDEATYGLINEVLERESLKIDTSELESFFGTLDDQTQKYIPKFDLKQTIESGKGPGLDISNLLSGVLNFVLKEIRINLKLLGQIIIIAVISSVMTGFTGQSSKNSSADVAILICRTAVIVIGINGFRIMIQTAQSAVSDVASFMQAIMPVLTSTLIAMGSINTAAVVSPLILLWVTFVSSVINNTVIPLFLVSFVLKMVNSISDANSVSKLSGLFKTAALTVLGLLSTVFLGVLSMKSGFANASDAVAAKATKFLSGALVPVVGKFFGDAIDLIATSSFVIKNVFGIFGICVLVVLILFPLLKILCAVFIFRIASAIIQPLGDEKIATCISDVADALINICASVSVVALMFFITISLIIGFGSSFSVAG